MKFVIAMLKHETNSFSPVATPWERFGGGSPFMGEDVVKEFLGSRTPIGAYLDFVRSIGAEYVTPIAAESMPSAPTAFETYIRLIEPIIDAVKTGCDAVLLDLHGAQISEGAPDAEKFLLQRLREIAPDIPIGVSFDLHGNISEAITKLATITNGYKTFPHIDMYETGQRVTEVIYQVLQGSVLPTTAWGRAGILTDTLKSGTDDGAMKALCEAARRCQARPGVLTASVYAGFPLGDFVDTGMAVVVSTDNDSVLAKDETQKLLDFAWSLREELTHHPDDLSESVRRAKEIPDGPVLLVDIADNCGSGGTQDTMNVIKEVIDQGLENVAVAVICDPEAVAEMFEAGVGAELQLDLGGKRDLPSIGVKGTSINLHGRVRTLSDGAFTITGPMYTGARNFMGRTAVFDTGTIEFVVTERNVEPWDVGVFTSAGIVPEHKKYLVLKSRVSYRAAFQSMAKAIIECSGEGVTSLDLERFQFKNLRRPIYPIDQMEQRPS